MTARDYPFTQNILSFLHTQHAPMNRADWMELFFDKSSILKINHTHHLTGSRICSRIRKRNARALTRGQGEGLVTQTHHQHHHDHRGPPPSQMSKETQHYKEKGQLEVCWSTGRCFQCLIFSQFFWTMGSLINWERFPTRSPSYLYPSPTHQEKGKKSHSPPHS